MCVLKPNLCEFTGPVEVYARKIFGRGKFYVAMAVGQSVATRSALNRDMHLVDYRKRYIVMQLGLQLLAHPTPTFIHMS